MHHKPQATRSGKRSGKGEFLISLFSSFPLLMVPNILIFWGERWGEYCFQVFYFLCRFSLKKMSRKCMIYPSGFPLFFTGFSFLLFRSFISSCPTLHAYMYHELVLSFSICNLFNTPLLLQK